jgi:hypothetical protein
MAAAARRIENATHVTRLGPIPPASWLDDDSLSQLGEKTEIGRRLAPACDTDRCYHASVQMDDRSGGP